MTEKIPSGENEIKESEVVEALKTKGKEAPEAFTLLTNWAKQEEKKVKTVEENIDLTRRSARLYLAAGYLAEALATMEDAWQDAFNAGFDNLCEEIEMEIADMK